LEIADSCVRIFPESASSARHARAHTILVPAESTARKKPYLKLAILFLILVVILAALAHAIVSWTTTAAARKLKNPVPATPEALAAGLHTYQQHCQKCHGANGDGKGEKASELSVEPGDFTDAEKMRGLTDGELFWEITKGKRPMPAFEDKLSDQERWQVVDFIRTFAEKPASSQP
jgi:mono/diheme cytochrome c family protein